MGALVAVIAAVAADRLRPPPTTGFLPIGTCRAVDGRPGDWLREGRWAVRVVSCSPAPAGDPPAALRTWQLTFADGGQAEVAEDERLELLSPIRLRSGGTPRPSLEVDGEHAVSSRHARILRRIHARHRDLGLADLDETDDGPAGTRADRRHPRACRSRVVASATRHPWLAAAAATVACAGGLVAADAGFLGGFGFSPWEVGHTPSTPGRRALARHGHNDNGDVVPYVDLDQSTLARDATRRSRQARPSSRPARAASPGSPRVSSPTPARRSATPPSSYDPTFPGSHARSRTAPPSRSRPRSIHMPTDFNAPSGRPGVSVGEDLADQLLASTFQNMLLMNIGGQLRDWVMAKQASPHRPGEDGHRDGFCRRCADLYGAGNALVVWDKASREQPPSADQRRDLARGLRSLADLISADPPQRREHHPGCLEEGLYAKYRVERLDGQDQPGARHHGCRYFPLDLSHDPDGRAVAAIYASLVEAERPRMAQDLRTLVKRLQGGDEHPHVGEDGYADE